MQLKEKEGDLSTAISLLSEGYKKYCRTNDKFASQLCRQMADYEVSLHDFETAIRHYKLALSHSEDDVNESNAIQISLAKLYLQVSIISRLLVIVAPTKSSLYELGQ